MNKKDIDELVKPIKEGFLSGNANPYKRPQFELCEPESMLARLAEIDMTDWYGYAFSREPLNGKFTEEQRRGWMVKSVACGQEYCHIICEKYGTSDPELLAESMGMEVSYPTLPEKTDRVLFAEYRMPNRISIYMDAVKKAEHLLVQPEIADIVTDKLDVKKLLLAHELFHHVEEEYKNEIFTQTEKIRLWSLGPVHNDSTIIALSEIAAMSFAKELTKIPYAPYLLDVLLVYGYSPMEASGLYEEMISLTGH